MNPILPRKHFIPDVEAHVMPDGRLYLYGSTDQSGSKEYCGCEHSVFSTDDPKLENWVDHGVVFRNTEDDVGVPWAPGVPLYAPDAIERNGKYYLYVCGPSPYEGVAESDHPYGPFGQAKPVVGADGDSIDPAIFIDDDNVPYYLWGQFNLKGGILKDDMSTLDEESIVTGIITEQEHGFHEGASLRKRNGKYYMVYTDISRGKATCMSYAISDNPLGPYKRGGTIIDNIYCDPQTWNNHGSIEEFNGQWYVFYHRSSQNSMTSRRVCAEPIFFNEDGSIDEVVMTSSGASGPIDAFSLIDASVACRMKGNVYIAPDKKEETVEINEILTNCGGGNWTYDWAEYKYINFEKPALKFHIRARGKGNILVMSEDNLLAAQCGIISDKFELYEVDLQNQLSGVLDLWLMFEGTDIDVDSFYFS